jgi:hypothetical protein
LQFTLRAHVSAALHIFISSAVDVRLSYIYCSGSAALRT